MFYQPRTLYLKDLGLVPRKVDPSLKIIEDEAFQAAFDSETLFYDVFFNKKRSKIFAIAPKLYNNLEFFENDNVEYYLVEPDSNQVYKKIHCELLSFKHLTLFIFHIDIDSFYHYAQTENVRLFIKLKHTLNRSGCVITVNNSLAHKFSNRRTIVTLNKNNDFTWIKDWLFWHYKHFGVNCVIIGDNGSTDYSLAELRNFLNSLPFLKDFLVIDWSFKYTLANVSRTTENFRLYFTECQTSFLNMLAKNHLELSSGFLQLDIDELLIPNEKGFDPFEFAQEFGWVSFASRNVFVNEIAKHVVSIKPHIPVNTPDNTSANTTNNIVKLRLELPVDIMDYINHAQHDLVLPHKFYQHPYEIRKSVFEAEITTSYPKYAVCPARLNPAAILEVHYILELNTSKKVHLELNLAKYFYLPLQNYSLIRNLRVFLRSEINIYDTFLDTTSMPFKFYHCRVLNKSWRQEDGDRKLDWLRILPLTEEIYQLEETSYIRDFFIKYANTY